MRRQGYDGEVGKTRFGPDAPGGLVPVHLGHLDIHQHQVIDHPFLMELFQGHGPVPSGVGLDADALKEFDRDLAVYLVVLHHKHPRSIQFASVLRAFVFQAAFAREGRRQAFHDRVEQH